MLQLFNNVDDLAVAHVRAVFFKSNAQHAHGGLGHINAVFQHKANQVARSVSAHVVVDAPARQNHLRLVA